MPRTIAAVAVALSAALPATGAAADIARGERLYERCAACHSLERDRTGPRHCGLVGRKAGTVPGFAYSEAMRASGLVWNAKSLDRFLAAPLEAVPGTSMGYAGIPDPGERRDLIAFLEQAGRSRDCR